MLNLLSFPSTLGFSISELTSRYPWQTVFKRRAYAGILATYIVQDVLAREAPVTDKNCKERETNVPPTLIFFQDCS